jgi:transposase
LLLCVIVHSAGVQDRDGAMMLISRLAHRFSLLKHIWVDGAYAGELVAWVYSVLGWTMEVVKRSDTLKKFIVLPRRWVVERTFAWISNYRIHAKDYCHNPKSAEASVYAASVNIMLRRLC